MPTLELTLDASGVERGARQAERALSGVGATASTTSATLKKSGTELSSAFAVTSGGIGASQGIASAVTQFQNLNTAAGAFAASRALLDIGRVGADFTNLSSAVGATGGRMQALGLIIRANPLLTIATVIAAAASAMSLFGNKTKEATNEVSGQARALTTLRDRLRETEFGVGIGGADPRRGLAGTQQTLQLLQRQIDSQLVPQLQTTTFGAAEAGRLFGVNPDQFRNLAARGGLGESAVELTQDPIRRRLTPFGEQPYQIQQFSAQQVVGAGRVLAREQSLDLEAAGFTIAERRAEKAAANRAEEERFRRQAEAQAQALESMEQLVERGREFGATIGDAFFNVASGTQTARQAIAQLVAELARAAAIRGFSNLFGAAVGGLTQTQTTNNIRTPGQP